jgi:phosphopantothenoylcysteine decarboxylase/phosphopantothenate--cysteine ligase
MAGAAGQGPPGHARPPAAAPRRPWRGRRVVLGVTGGIAAYKSVQIARDLTKLGAEVDVILTAAARDFVGSITFEALTGRPVRQHISEPGHALDHIRLAREADVVCVAPATADTISRTAAGRADDLLTAVLLATRAPVLICPAMNDAMWDHPQTRANVEHLRDALGHTIVGPVAGPLAWGEGSGPGRMSDEAEIIEHIGRALEPGSALTGRTVLVTAGPTREPVDPVRVISNRSSGRMGGAIAAAAWRRGANVTLVAGPATASLPHGPAKIQVETAAEMAAAVGTALPDSDVLVMAAAVADFTPASPAERKMKRADGVPTITLEPAPDILVESRPQRRPGLVAVGFALETGDGEAEARRKLESKGLDLIVLNRADEEDAGFEVDTNRVTLIGRSGEARALPLMSKDDVAEEILDRVIDLLDRGA